MRYDTASLRRPPARRPDAGHLPPPVTHRVAPSRATRQGASRAAEGAGQREAGWLARDGAGRPGGSTGDIGGVWMKLHKVSALAAVSILAFAACSRRRRERCPERAGWQRRSRRVTPARAPSRSRSSSRSRAASSRHPQPIINGIRLAVKQAGGGAGGYAIEIPDSVDLRRRAQRRARPADRREQHDQDRRRPGHRSRSSARSTRASAWRRSRSRTRRGLLQCSPANTNPDLTKGAPAASRPSGPSRTTTSASTTTDDIQGPAASQYIFDVLGKKSVYIIDDTETFGKGVADAFEADFGSAAAPSSSTTQPRRPPRTTSRS